MERIRPQKYQPLEYQYWNKLWNTINYENKLQNTSNSQNKLQNAGNYYDYLQDTSNYQDRLQDKRQQTRDEIFNVNYGDRENKDETCDAKQKHSFVAQLEDELHHVKQEIQKLNEVGKFDQSDKLEHRAKEIFVEIEQHKNHEEKIWHDEEKFKERVEQIIEERRTANVRLEELVNALEQFDDIDGESADEEREQLKMTIHRIESHVDRLTKELERFDK